MICAVALTSCARAAAPASEPVLEQAHHALQVPPPTVGGILYDEQAMREVIAGCDLVIGDVRAERDACEARGKALAKRVLEVTGIARKLNTWAWLGPVIAGTLCAIVGGGLGFFFGVMSRAQAVLP
jgi:hypothetical protein